MSDQLPRFSGDSHETKPPVIMENIIKMISSMLKSSSTKKYDSFSFTF